MSSFAKAERYIQLRKTWNPTTWGETVLRTHELILTPLLTLFQFLLRDLTLWSLVPAALGVYRAWSDWVEYTSLRFDVQRMYLETMSMGGPFITTNDASYLPYVYADAVTRGELHRSQTL